LALRVRLRRSTSDAIPLAEARPCSKLRLLATGGSVENRARTPPLPRREIPRRERLRDANLERTWCQTAPARASRSNGIAPTTEADPRRGRPPCEREQEG